MGISSGWSDPGADDAAIRWTREYHEAIAPYATGGIYANYLDFDDDQRVKSAYGANFERLQKVKAQYDPSNLFRAGQSIPMKT